ncbi:hypothetical protein BC939DRAFT_477966 [Gamsiella multidivaricata]|uniref:uncharacterized protein n=1 Tax=Gamsiella multidivaricata TaxID=101098 RepID=UPI0022200B40|nr:uncharacterized protein BC939DRAFT_477966 [Gamsiella multidivaricata]KAI7821970.1 hypothetical protein BC939DRAFT_477966 [Gamsiella multidivaricata]
MAVPPGTSLFLGLVSGSSAVLMDTVNTSSTILPKPSPDPKTTNITLITTSTTPAAATATVLATTTTATTTKFHTTSSPSSQMTYPTMYSSPPSPHTAHLQRDNPLALTTPVYTQKPAASTSNVPALSNTPIPNNHNNDPLVTLDIEEDSENYSGSKEHSDFGQNPVSAHMSPKAPAISDLSTPSGEKYQAAQERFTLCFITFNISSGSIRFAIVKCIFIFTAFRRQGKFSYQLDEYLESTQFPC